jgi:ribulose kinase
MQMHADVSNVPITLTEVPDAPALGSAILGAVAAGLFPDVTTAAAQMVHVRERIEPDAAAHEQYQFFVDQYIATYGRVQDLIQATTRHVARG